MKKKKTLKKTFVIKQKESDKKINVYVKVVPKTKRKKKPTK